MLFRKEKRELDVAFDSSDMLLLMVLMVTALCIVGTLWSGARVQCQFAKALDRTIRPSQGDNWKEYK